MQITGKIKKQNISNENFSDMNLNFHLKSTKKIIERLQTNSKINGKLHNNLMRNEDHDLDNLSDCEDIFKEIHTKNCSQYINLKNSVKHLSLEDYKQVITKVDKKNDNFMLTKLKFFKIKNFDLDDDDSRNFISNTIYKNRIFVSNI